MKEASSKRSSRAQPHLNLCNVRRQGDTLCAAKALASEPAKPILACLVWGDPSPTRCRIPRLLVAADTISTQV
jgi:hypothetical protein